MLLHGLVVASNLFVEPAPALDPVLDCVGKLNLNDHNLFWNLLWFLGLHLPQTGLVPVYFLSLLGPGVLTP